MSLSFDDLYVGQDRMAPHERLLAERVYEAIQHASLYSTRSQQSSSFKVGISDLGFCQERTRRLIAEIEPVSQPDVLPAFLGTAIGDHVEEAITTMWPEARRHENVTVVLTGDGGRVYQISGHPDILMPDMVIDVKTTFGLETVKRTGSSKQQKFQRNLYALGAWQAGLMNCELEEVQVANVWIDRSGETRECFAELTLFDPEVVAEAARWLDDVVYAHANGQTAMKEPPRQMCYAVCGHALDCRGADTDVEGLITDPETVATVDTYAEGMRLESLGAKLKKEAKAGLKGVSGNTPTHSVRWVTVPGTHVEAFDKRGYDRLSITPLKDV
jgi:hypothetical protein